MTPTVTEGLLGDAAHSVHFSVGSGTRLALEDAIILSESINNYAKLDIALQKYQDIRKKEMEYLMDAGYNSMLWFENVNKLEFLDPSSFAEALFNRSR